MTELRIRFIEDLHLAGLDSKSIRVYVWAVHQLAAYYMVPPDQLSERQVQQYLLYLRDELAAPKGTFTPVLAAIRAFYVRTLGYDWPLLTKKKFASRPGNACQMFALTRTVVA